MLGFAAGLLYSNAVEWGLHRFVLHGLGKAKDSAFTFHWKRHHKNARRFGMYDPDYEQPLWDWEARGKEAAHIGLIMLGHAPLWWVSKGFAVAVWFTSLNYLRRHRKSHVDVAWARTHMPWHYDHHMGRDQDANWCVSYSWFDWLMGTREPGVYSDAADDAGHDNPSPWFEGPTFEDIATFEIAA